MAGQFIPTLDGEYCKIYTRENKVYTGTILSKSPAVHVYKDAASRTRNIEEIFVRIDEVVKTKEDVEALGIDNGDFVCYDSKTMITDKEFIKSRFIDDKISVAILLTYLKYLKDHQLNPQVNIVCLFSTYEEVGHGMAYLPVKLDELISVDMGCIGLAFKCDEYMVSICAKIVQDHMTIKLHHAL